MNGIARCAESSDPWKHRVDEDKALGPAAALVAAGTSRSR
jgi:hypothetical protein